MLRTHTHDLNLENRDADRYDRFCYATGYNEAGDRLVGCCLYEDEYDPGSHQTRDGKLVHLDPDEGLFLETVEEE